MQHVIEYKISLTRVLDGLTEEQAREYEAADKAYLTRVLSSGATRHLNIDGTFFQLDLADVKSRENEIADECEACRINLDELNAEQQEHNLPTR